MILCITWYKSMYIFHVIIIQSFHATMLSLKA